MIRIVLFDLDDTLVDQDAAMSAALLGWATELGLITGPDDPAADAHATRWDEVSRPAYARYQRREIGFQDQRRERVRAFLGIDADDAEADHLFSTYLARYQAGWRAFDDALPALERVRVAGLVPAILTNGNTAQQRQKLELTGLSGHVDTVISSDQLPAGKPDPRSYAAACDVLAVGPGHILMVGDDVEKDYLGPLAAGFDAVLLDRSGRHVRADHRRIATLDALPI